MAAADEADSCSRQAQRFDTSYKAQIPRAGFEPTTPGLGNRKAILAKDDAASTCDDAENYVACYVALLERENPDLAAVVKGCK